MLTHAFIFGHGPSFFKGARLILIPALRVRQERQANGRAGWSAARLPLEPSPAPKLQTSSGVPRGSVRRVVWLGEEAPPCH